MNAQGRPIRVGSRGSRLALSQTGMVIEELRAARPELQFAVQVIKTAGDRPAGLKTPLGEGIFVKELEEALRGGAIDMAVHSLKDLPSLLSPEFVVAAIIKRGDPCDVLVSRSGQGLKELPAGARIGTGSPRREAQVLHLRPDLQVVPFRGNVDTRLRKIQSGKVDAAILAGAAMVRMGLAEHITEYLPMDVFVPAVGQGALAVEVLAADTEMVRLVAAADDQASRCAVEAERAFLRALGGGCRAPIAAYGVVTDGQLVLKGMFVASEGATPVFAQETGPASEPEQVGERLARRVLAGI